MLCNKRPKIEMSPAFVLLLSAYFYFDPAQSFFSFLLSVTLHEAGHLLALRLLGAKLLSLRFGLTGAVIQTDVLSYSRELIVSAAGPAVSFALFLSCAKCSPIFALVNFCLLLFNMLPFYPLDGGRILRATLHLLLCDRAAELMERVIGILCLVLLGAAACYLTCVWHCGLWPVLAYALLLLRVTGMLLPKIFAMK